MKALVDMLRRGRLIVLLFCLGLCGVAGALLPRLQVETDFMNFLPESDQDLAFFKETGETFGGNYIGMVAVQAEDVFTHDVLVKLQRLTKAYEEIEGIASVMSLANVLDIRQAEDGIEVVDLLPDGAVPEDQAALEALRAYVLSKEMYTSTFVSEAGTTAALIVRLLPSASEEQVAKALYRTTDELWGPERSFFGGFPIVMEHLFSTLWQDMKLLTSLVAGVILLILFLSFRAARGVVLPLLTVVAATLLGFGAMALARAPVTIISSIIPVVLFSTGTAYTIHLLNAVSQEPQDDGDRWGALGRAMSKVGVAILLSGLTTFVGFLALISSPLILFRDFGIYCAIGVGFALLISMTVIPITLSWLKPRAARPRESGGQPLLNKLLISLAGLVSAHPRKILLVATVSVALGSIGLAQLRSEMNVFTFIGEESEPRRAEELIKAEFGGTMPVAINVNAAMQEPLVLDELLRFERRLRLFDHLSGMSSIADLIAEMNQKLNGWRAIPSSKRGVASLWLLIEGNEALTQMVTEGSDRAMVQGRAADIDNKQMNQIVGRINGLISDQVRPQLVELSFEALAADARAQLARQAADEIVAEIELDLRFRDLRLETPDDLRSALLTRLAKPLPPAATEQRRALAQAYFSSDDCDLELEEAAQIPLLVEASTTVPDAGEQSLAAAITRAAPTLAAEDPEGIELAAAALHRQLRDAAVLRSVDELIAALPGMVTPAEEGWPELLREELRAALRGATASSWTVTPARYTELSGSAPDPAQVITLQLRQTGLPVMNTTLDQQLVRSQIVSLGVALITVFILLIIQLRSVIGGLISIVPIVFTLLLNFGAMGLLGITVNPGTMLIAALAIGIGIDYTIHIMTRLRNELARHDDEQAALAETLRSSGRAVLINAAAVALGFAVLAASQLVIVKQLGLLVAWSMLVCCLGALTLIPALVLVLKPTFIHRGGAPTR